MLAKLYGAIMEAELNDYIETLSLEHLNKLALDEHSILLTISSHLDV